MSEYSETTTLSVIDLSVIEVIYAEQGADIIHFALSRFLPEAQQYIAELNMAVQQSKMELLSLRLHSLRTMSAMIGATSFSALCLHIEELVSLQQDISVQITQLLACWPALEQTIIAWLDSHAV